MNNGLQANLGQTPRSFEQRDPALMARALSFLVDFSLIAIIKSTLHMSYQVMAYKFLGPLNHEFKMNLIESNMIVHFLIFSIIYCSYFFFTLYCWEGRTLGKVIFKLRVISDEFTVYKSDKNYQLHSSSIYKRVLGYFICYLSSGIFFIFNLSSEDKRGLSDYISQTRTVREDWVDQQLKLQLRVHSHLIEIESLEKCA